MDQGSLSIAYLEVSCYMSWCIIRAPKVSRIQQGQRLFHKPTTVCGPACYASKYKGNQDAMLLHAVLYKAFCGRCLVPVYVEAAWAESAPCV